MREILARTWRFEESTPAPAPPGLERGARTALRFAGYGLALLDALSLQEVEREYAIELIADIAWRIERHLPVELVPCPAALGAHACSGHASEVSTCLVADLLRARGAVDLCRAAWCGNAYAAAERGGHVLHRDAPTIAEGAETCRMHETDF